jgi:hypothetical protein
MADCGAGSIDAGAAMDEHRFGEFVEILLHRLLIVPTSTQTPSIHAVSWRFTFEVARFGESLSRRHNDAEKISRPERRRPRRHQHFIAMRLQQPPPNPTRQYAGPILVLAGF